MRLLLIISLIISYASSYSQYTIDRVYYDIVGGNDTIYSNNTDTLWRKLSDNNYVFAAKTGFKRYVSVNDIQGNLAANPSIATALGLKQDALGFTPYNATNPDGFISAVPAQTFASITGKPTTLLGYGITDAYPLAGNPSNFLVAADIVGKQNTITLGTTLQYFRGDLSLETFPTTTAAFTNSTNKNFVTDAQATVIGNTSGTNSGNDAANTTYANDFRAANFVAGTNYLAPNGSAAALISFPTLNQNTTGTSLNVTGTVAIANGGTGQITASASFNALAPSKTGNTLKYLRVNAGETDYELVTLAGGGDLLAANNLSDVTNAGTSRTNLGLGNVTNESKVTMFTSAALTSTPTAPTPTFGTNTTQIATTEFVTNRQVVKNLGTDLTSSSVTMVKATNLDQTVGVGTWVFEYHIMWQTTATATAIKLGVNHSGTVTRFVTEATGFEATTAASTGVNDEAHAAFGLRAGGQNNTISTTVSIFGPTAVITANADHYAVIRGIIVVTVSGDLQLYFGSEATGSTQTLELPTSLILTRIN